MHGQGKSGLDRPAMQYHRNEEQGLYWMRSEVWSFSSLGGLWRNACWPLLLPVKERHCPEKFYQPAIKLIPWAVGQEFLPPQGLLGMDEGRLLPGSGADEVPDCVDRSPA